MDKHTLYLDFPAERWESASPVGNGFSGAMLFGGVGRECIQLSHESIWSGGKLDTADPSFRDKLERLREVLLTDPAGADDLAGELLSGSFHRIKSNETAGNILIDCGIDEYSDYRRELELFTGISHVTFRAGGRDYCRETFASYPDRVICQRFTGAHSASISYSRRRTKVDIDWNNRTSRAVESEDRYGVDSITVSGNTLVARAHPASGGKPFTVKLRVETDGELCRSGETLAVRNAGQTDIFIVIGVGSEPEFPTLGYEELRARSVKDFSSLMERAGIGFGDDRLSELSVDKRLERLKNDPEVVDPGLLSLYFDFGRYLLVSSSRPGSLPANLQGVWNTYTEAPWNSDYHTNINLQMNYWHAESANLSECALPLFDFMNEYLLESGRETARVNYRCRGTVLHHLTDIYGFTAPADGVWGLWPLGGAWLCYTMWEHWLYTRDTDFLRNTAYSYIHDSARFFLDYMFEDREGRLLSGPSTSPENRYFKDGKPVSLCLSPTMDVEIIGGLLGFYIETERLLGLDPGQKKEAEDALSKLPPLKVGKHGQLMEWLEDYDEPEPGHRHVSHLFALYPGCAISRGTPELFAAAKRSLERRLANGGGHTGWSCAWLIALFARLGDRDGVSSMIRKLFTRSTRENLLDSHPPFQIDGNFGAAAAFVEMLMQSHSGRIELLPACPEWLHDGSFYGLCARGGAEVSAKWSGGAVVSCVIKAVRQPLDTLLAVNGRELKVRLAPGESFVFEGSDGR